MDDDWDSEAEPEFLKNAVSLSSTYDPEVRGLDIAWVGVYNIYFKGVCVVYARSHLPTNPTQHPPPHKKTQAAAARRERRMERRQRDSLEGLFEGDEGEEEEGEQELDLDALGRGLQVNGGVVMA